MRPAEATQSQSRPGEWREGESRPVPGNTPHDRLVSRGIFSSSRSVSDDPFSVTPSHDCKEHRGLSVAFSRHGGIYLVRWGSTSKSKSKPNPGTAPTASRWSAPHPGKRSCREDHALSHRPQMSSGRLFLDRVARQRCPSPLHRHTQNNTHFRKPRAKGDISTLLKMVTFLLCVDNTQTAPLTSVEAIG